MKMEPIKAPFDRIRTYSSMTEFWEKNGNRIIQFWVFKRMFTPMEKERKYMDQSCYEETSSRAGVIREVIKLPDNDLLLGIAELCEDVDELRSELSCLVYYKLSELRITYCPHDEIEYGLICEEPEVEA